MAYSPLKKVDLQISTFRGVAEDIDMALIGKNPTEVIKAGDTIFSALEWDTEDTIATLADVTANVSISRNGYITNDSAPTSDIWQGLLFWHRGNDSGAGAAIGPLALKSILVTGGNAAADLTATGLEVGDTLIGVLHLTTAAQISSMVDVTHLCSIGGAAVLNCSIATNSDHLWVFYHDANGTAYNNPSLQFEVLDGTTATTDITVTGATSSDVVVFVGHITTKAAVASIADLTSEGSFTDDDDFQMGSTDTSNDQLFLIWLDVA